MIQNRVKIFLSVFLLPLLLAGCGSTGGASLDDSASLAPTLAQGDKQITSSTAAVPKGTSSQKALSKKAVASKAHTDKKAGGHVVAKSFKTAKADRTPVPVKRPYRKVRKKKPIAVMAKKKSVRAPGKIALQKPVSKAPEKSIVKAKPIVEKTVAAKVATAKPVAPKPVVAKPVAAPMVPLQVIPVQIMPVEAPQDIQDAFNEAPAPVKPAPEKMAKAEAVPIQHSFGQSDHRFSGQ